MKRTNKANNKMNMMLAGLLALCIATISTPKAAAADSGLNSAKAAIQLRATLPAQLKLSLADISLNISVADPAQNSQVVSVPVTSTWVLDSTTSNVELVGYFDSPQAAMMDRAGHAIPADHVLGGLVNESMLPFVESSRVGTDNASRTFFRQQISNQNVSASRTDTVQIQLRRIDDIHAPASQYRGVLHLRLVSY
ncbi:MAG TPA: hypothetical protein VGF06_00130 [Terriglobales bacterium]|jgi:hypothetical protein